jgi:hypothetical protein
MVDLMGPNHVAELWLMIVCLAIFVVFIVTLILAPKWKPPRITRGEWQHQHRVSKVRNGFKSRSA